MRNMLSFRKIIGRETLSACLKMELTAKVIYITQKLENEKGDCFGQTCFTFTNVLELMRFVIHLVEKLHNNSFQPVTLLDEDMSNVTINQIREELLAELFAVNEKKVLAHAENMREHTNYRIREIMNWYCSVA